MTVKEVAVGNVKYNLRIITVAMTIIKNELYSFLFILFYLKLRGCVVVNYQEYISLFPREK